MVLSYHASILDLLGDTKAHGVLGEHEPARQPDTERGTPYARCADRGEDRAKQRQSSRALLPTASIVRNPKSKRKKQIPARTGALGTVHADSLVVGIIWQRSCSRVARYVESSAALIGAIGTRANVAVARSPNLRATSPGIFCTALLR